MKSAYVLGGLGVAATPAVGYGGWALYTDVINPAPDRPLTKRGFRRSRARHGGGFTSNFLHKDKTGCFANFFPGSGSMSTLPLLSDDFSSYDVDNFFRSKDESSSDSSKPLGCALAQLNYQKKDSIHTLSFRSEVAIKKGNLGWVLWDRFESISSDGLRWAMAVIFLNRRSEDHWSVAGAFYQDFTETSGLHLGKIKLSIGGDNWTLPAQSDSDPIVKRYSGMWEGSEPDGEHIFRGFNVNYDSKKWSLYGIQNSSGAGEFSDFSLHTHEFYVYDLKGTHWGPHTLFKDSSVQQAIQGKIKEKLKTLHESFRDQKGKWSDFADSDLCNTPPDVEKLSKEQLEKIKSFCYIKW